MRVYFFICLVMFGLIHFSLQVAKIEGDCSKIQFDLEKYKNRCNKIVCIPSGGDPDITPCGLRSSDCGPVKRFVGTKFDREKEYPDCCVQIICEEFEPEDGSTK